MYLNAEVEAYPTERVAEESTPLGEIIEPTLKPT